MATFNQLQDISRGLTADEVNLISKAIAKEYIMLNRVLQGIIRAEYNKITGRGVIVGSDEYVRSLRRWLPTGLNKSTKAIQRTLDSVNSKVVQSSTIGITNNYYRSQYAFSWFAPLSSVPVTLDFTFIDPVAVQMSVFGNQKRWNALRDITRKELLSGLRIQGNRPTLKNLLLKNDRRTLSRINNGITRGIIEGEGIQKISSIITNDTGITGREIRRIVRTETHRNMAAGQYMSYLDAKEQGLVTNRQIRAVKDTRTRLQSSQVDSQLDIGPGNTFIYPDGRLVAYPGNSGNPSWDINDREYVIQIIDGVPPFETVARDPETGLLEEATFKDFNDWKDSKGLIYKNGVLVKK